MEVLTIGDIKFQTLDLGGHTVARKTWSEYFTKVDALVYFVDAVDRERFPESKRELDVRRSLVLSQHYSCLHSSLI